MLVRYRLRSLGVATLMATLGATTFASANGTKYSERPYPEMFDFDSATVVEMGPDETGVPKWAFLDWPEGRTLYPVCEAVLSRWEVLEDISIDDCQYTLEKINGLRNWDNVPAGAQIGIPHPDNTNEAIAAQLEDYRAVHKLAANPLGMADAIRQLSDYNFHMEEWRDGLEERLDAQAERLDTVETGLSVERKERKAYQEAANDEFEAFDRRLNKLEENGVDMDALRDVFVSFGFVFDEDGQVVQPNETDQSPALTERQRVVLQALSDGVDEDGNVDFARTEDIAPVVKKVLEATGYLDEDGNRVPSPAANTASGGGTVPPPAGPGGDSGNGSGAGTSNYGWLVPTGLSVLAIIGLVGLSLVAWFYIPRLSKVEQDVNDEKTGLAAAHSRAAAAATKDDVDSINDRLTSVETAVGFLMELDAQGRFNNPDLTEELVQDLKPGDEPIILHVKCKDGRYRHVHVTRGASSDGRARLQFLGLQKGCEFIHDISLIALLRHLRKAVQNDWVVGVEKARAAT